MVIRGYLVDGEDDALADGLAADVLMVEEVVEHLAGLDAAGAQVLRQGPRVEQDDAGLVEAEVGEGRSRR
ncbi:hypothetical protein MFU01_09960 [Myxococcus fulvus]|uniref:Uncharacterized protein n=1 Tax=Myxococcus fulvus TaxID=33 RepID=A0A511SVN8_MYXFU|nr:hypothetical protein [Myxococcus fulvus]GEN05959.1 hypothetical protein MFU01_09960 [Myxococcus fulvus]